jgi:hypothetical protein
MKLIFYGILFIFANLFQSICLHIATKKYLDSNNHTQLIDIVNIEYNIPIIYLDLIAIFTLLLFIISYLFVYYFDKNIYYILIKTIILASTLAIMKGIFDLVTIIPDSSGYEKCISRLGNDTIYFLINLNFNNDFLNSLIKILKVEIMGLNNKHMRYCADMMLSGHTFYVVLYNIATYDIITKYIKNVIICFIIKMILISIIIIEIILILISKFHYTSDVLLSLVIVILLYNFTYINKINNNYENYEYIDP